MPRTVKPSISKAPKKLSESLGKRGLIHASEKSKRRTHAATDRLLREMQDFLKQSPPKK